jgi:hypothetical protein
MRVKSLFLFSALAVGAIIPARAVPPVAATQVKAYAPNQSRVHLAWIDNATDETSYYIDRWNPTTMAWVGVGEVPANSEVFRLAAPSTTEQEVKYRVAPFKTGEIEANLNWVEATVTKPEAALDLYLNPNGGSPQEVPEGWEARVGVPFTHQIEVYNGTPETFTATGLASITASVPVTLNSNTGVISGTVSSPGVYRIYIGITFDGGKVFEQVRFLRVLPAASVPVVAAPNFSLPTQNIGVEGFLDIRQLFSDPSRPKGAWFDTSEGSFIVALFDKATPRRSPISWDTRTGVTTTSPTSIGSPRISWSREAGRDRLPPPPRRPNGEPFRNKPPCRTNRGFRTPAGPLRWQSWVTTLTVRRTSGF